MILEESGTSIFKVKVNRTFYSEDADCIHFLNTPTYLTYNRVSHPKDYKPLQKFISVIITGAGMKERSTTTC